MWLVIWRGHVTLWHVIIQALYMSYKVSSYSSHGRYLTLFCGKSCGKSCYTLHVAGWCCMFHFAWYMVHVTCYMLVRAECVRCPWALLRNEVSTVFGIIVRLGQGWAWKYIWTVKGRKILFVDPKIYIFNEFNLYGFSKLVNNTSCRSV